MGGSNEIIYSSISSKKCNKIYWKLANRYVSSFNKILFKIVCHFVNNQRFIKLYWDGRISGNSVNGGSNCGRRNEFEYNKMSNKSNTKEDKSIWLIIILLIINEVKFN